MKFLNYVGSLFIPTKMGQRKNISVFVSILILLIASYIIAIPYMTIFEKNAYETYCEAAPYNFRIMNRETSEEAAWTDEEKLKFGENTTTVEELKKLDFTVEKGLYVLPNGIKELKDVPYNGTEFFLKRNVFNYDKDGTKLDKVDTYYIHLVFDIFDKKEDGKYVIEKDFTQKYNHTDENHFLYVLYYDGLAYRNKYMIEKDQHSYGFAYNKTNIKFSEMDDIDYLAKKVSEVLIPQTKTMYTFNGFIYTVLCPILVCLVAMLFIQKKNVLTKFKHYFNIAALTTIPMVLLFFCLEWSTFMIRIGLMELYWLFFTIYFFVVVSIINKQKVIE